MALTRQIFGALLLALVCCGSAAAQVATNLVFDTTVAPFAPLASQSHVGFGWTDAQTNTWTTDSSGNIVASANSLSPASLLYRPGSGAGTSALTAGVQENSLNQRVKLSFVLGTTATSNAPAIILRSNQNNASLNGYIWLLSGSLSEVRAFSTVAGTSTQFYTASTGSLTVGHNYTLDVEADQTNGTTTTFFLTVIDNTSSTTLLNNVSTTNTVATLQNPATSGVGIDSTGNGTAQTVTKVQYYSDQTVNPAPAATAYTVTLATNGNTGLGQAGTITTTGITLSSTLSVTLSSSAGSTFSPNPVTIVSGQQSNSFTYTPAVHGSDTVSWTYSGGNAGMTGNGNQVETITDPVNPLDGNLYWSDGWLLAIGGAYTNNSGNYLKMAFTGSSFQVLFDVTNIKTGNVTSSEWPVIRYSVDGGAPVDLQLSDQGTNSYSLTLAGALSGATTHTFWLLLRNETQAFNRWTVNGSGFPPSGLRIQGFIVANGATTVPLTGTILAPKNCQVYFFGDSITEGAKTSWPLSPFYSDSEATWTNATAQTVGCEYTNYAFSGQAYSGQLGVPDVPHFDGAWDLRFAGTSKLSGGTFVTNSILPKFIFVNMGTNDAANSASKTVGAIKTLLTAIKAASPSSTMILVLPFAFNQPYFSAQGYGAYLLSEYQAYQVADPSTLLVSLGTEAGIGLGAYPASGTSNPYSIDQLHPGGQRSVNLGTLVGQYVNSKTGGGPNRAQIYWP